MKCKFCGCSNRRPCRIPVDVEGNLALGSRSLDYLPCSWLIPDVCTSPACVEKAYIEATAIVDTLIEIQELAS